MYKKRSIKTSIVIGILLMTTVGLFIPSSSASISINDNDGIWLDDFKYETQIAAEENITIDNCKIDNTNGVISLNPEIHPRTYNFNEEDFQHKASTYRWISFRPRSILPITQPDSFWSREFNARDYNAIESLDNVTATRSSFRFYKNVVQEFRFQLDVGSESIGSIEIFWQGEAINANKVKMYYWTLGELGLTTFWKELGTNNSGKIIFNKTIDADQASLAVMENNYFYVCIVATTNNIVQTCSLSTDFIEISSLAEEAWDTGPGFITTNTTIAPGNDFYWEMLTWDDYEPDQTSIRYQILYDPQNNGTFVPIPDESEYFSGSNEQNGFSSSPLYLNKIPTSGPNAIKKIRIRANLSSLTAAKTPKIYNWAVTWQKNPDLWQDSFNSTYRIETKRKINIGDGSLNISSIQGEWPMFGHNPDGTRSTDGRGPQSSNPPLKWYTHSSQLVGGGFRNPVIGDGYIYVFNQSDGLLKYDIQGNKPNHPIAEVSFYPGSYHSSPLLTEDYVILASGNTGKKGRINYIRGLSKDLSSWWKFEYNEKICYYSSPVVYENKVYITSWNGDTRFFSDIETNKVIALDLDKMSVGNTYSNEDEALLWEYDLPAGSYSTPTVNNGMVFVACQGNGDSFFILDAEGNGDGTTNLLWSTEIGSVGKASPVIYNGTAYVISKSLGKMMVTALSIENTSNDRILWQKIICRIPDGSNADSTPTIYDNILYVASPRGVIYALDGTDGSTLWSKRIYTTFLSKYLTSSPAYAEGYLYIGTPEGKILALDTLDNGSIIWEKSTFETENFVNAAIFSSPVISNGMLFISDEEGTMYAFGTYEELNKEMTGSITSIPINLPTGDWWGKFNVNYTSKSGSNIRFSILDGSKQHLKNISDGSVLNLGSQPDLRTIYLHADLTADNLTVNPIIRWWKVTFIQDNSPPEFVRSSFKPNPDGWLKTIPSKCSINVWDNKTGLFLEDATCKITYDTQNQSGLTKSITPFYTGKNGVNFSTLTANISDLDFSRNITNLSTIQFKIRDFGDNEVSETFDFRQDIITPTSSISNETNGSEFNNKSVQITADINDPGDENSASGVILTELYYRHSLTKSFSGSWQFFENSTDKTPTWNFTDKEHGGYYELCTITYDLVGNVEELSEKGDTWFIIDNEKPDKPSFSGEHWFKELPMISIDFRDDFKLDTIKYQPNFDTDTWITIKSDINSRTYSSSWELKQEFWDQMEDEQQYTLNLWINDTLGNTRIISKDDGYIIVRDEEKPKIDLDIPDLETEWSLDDTITISAFASDGDGSGITSVELFYRYSEDGDFSNETWISYGVLTSAPFEWEFEGTEGNGYYEFKTVAQDAAGNSAESEVFSTGINLFPTTSVAAMIILIVALIVITFIIIIKWRKK